MATLDIKLADMQRALFDAAKNDDIEKLENLQCLLTGVNKHWKDYPMFKTGDSLLHVAVREGHIDAVRYLCEQWPGSDLNLEASNNLGKKCLHDAAQTCHHHITDYLLKRGAAVNCLKGGDWTPLMLVSTRTGTRALDTIKVLLAHGADPLLRNKDGWTSLHVACRAGDVQIVDFLIHHGTQAVSCSSYNGRTPLHIAALHGHVEVVKRLLLENSCHVDTTDTCGFTPLMESVRGGHIDIIHLLIENRADINRCDKMGRGCMHLAAETGHVDVIQYLTPIRISNVDSASDTSGLTPLHCAVRCGQSKTVKQLLEIGANPLLQDTKGRTALDFCYGNHMSEIRELLASSLKK